MLDKGRDVYGPEHSPLFAAALDRRTFQPPESPSAIEGIRSHDRALNGSNAMHHQNLYQVLYGLTAATGDPRYAEEADKALSFLLANCQSPATGLLAWGEHMSWNFFTERPDGFPEGGGDPEERTDDIHEFFRPWALFGRSLELNRDASLAMARGLWEHQIHDHETGEFSRHAQWSRHGTGVGNAYPRHGGFYIRIWGEAFAASGDEVFPKAIEKLLDFYESTASEKTGAIPCCTREDRKTIMWPPSNLGLAIDLAEIRPLVPSLEARIDKFLEDLDRNFLELDHDPGPGGRGYSAGADTETLETFDEGLWTRSSTWAIGYGSADNAFMAVLGIMRYRQNGDERYRDLALRAAQEYLETDPPSDAVLYPGNIARIIWLLLDAAELTGEERYRERARHFAALSQELFFDGESPLPKASTVDDHYEAITLGDSLMLSLLRLSWPPDAPAPGLAYTDR